MMATTVAAAAPARAGEPQASSPSSPSRPPLPSPLPPGVVFEDGLLKSIFGWTWPGIEWGEAPGPRHTYYEYLQSLRDDDLGLFSRIQAADRAWWHPLTDRGGTGCSLHAAAGACASRSVRFLVEVKKVPVNVRARSDGATPLHRAAAAAHHSHTDPRAMEVIEYLLSKGADPEARTRGTTGGRTGEREEEEGGGEGGGGGDSLSVLGCAVERGHGWAVGEVRGMLREAFARHASVPKAPLLESLDEEEEERRRGRGRRQQRPRPPPPVAAAGAALLRTWRLLAPSLPYPPANWRPPPPAGWAGAVGTLACGGGGVASDFGTFSSSFADGGEGGKGGGKGGGGNENATSFSSSAGGPQAPGWRPAGSPGDGSCWLRRATKAELDAQAAAAAALAEPE